MRSGGSKVEASKRMAPITWAIRHKGGEALGHRERFGSGRLEQLKGGFQAWVSCEVRGVNG